MSAELRVAAAISLLRGKNWQLERRRKYAERWHAYAREVFGYVLTPQQEAVLEAMRIEDRLLIPSAQNVGKTWILALGALCIFDPVAALPGPDGREQQGARILLPGPDAATVYATVYAKMLGHVARAAARGWMIPGEWSERSVLVRVPGDVEWTVEAHTPPKRVNTQQAHSAAGRHHVNQHALIEEGNGVEERLWTSVEGMCSGLGNKIISPYNPTEPAGPAIERERGGTYRVLRLSALDHPNVRGRSVVVPGAVSHEQIDSLVRDHTIDQGPAPGTPLDPDRGDFVYAVAPKGTPESGVRTDGVPGHAAAPPRVRRPLPRAEVSILGRTASAGEFSLFNMDSIQRAQERWKATPEPAEKPHRIGCDPAREGSDDACAAPAWGDAAEPLLRAWHHVQANPEALAKLHERRARVGSIVVLPKGDGKAVADALHARYGSGPYSIDDGGVGTSPIDMLVHVHHAQVGTLSFGGAPPSPLWDGAPQCENLRTALYVYLSMLLARDLVDLPPDSALVAELLAQRIEYRTRSVAVLETRRRVTSVLLESKDKVKQRIGRSPDRSDTAVCALMEPPLLVTASAKRETRVAYGGLKGSYGPGGMGSRRTFGR